MIEIAVYALMNLTRSNFECASVKCLPCLGAGVLIWDQLFEGRRDGEGRVERLVLGANEVLPYADADDGDVGTTVRPTPMVPQEGHRLLCAMGWERQFNVVLQSVDVLLWGAHSVRALWAHADKRVEIERAAKMKAVGP